jgi:hypothetical protein
MLWKQSRVRRQMLLDKSAQPLRPARREDVVRHHVCRVSDAHPLLDAPADAPRRVGEAVQLRVVEAAGTQAPSAGGLAGQETEPSFSFCFLERNNGQHNSRDTHG